MNQPQPGNRAAPAQTVAAAEPDAAIAALGEAVYVLDAAGCLRFASTRTLNVWGLTADQALGRPIEDISPAARETAAGPAQRKALLDRQEVHLCVVQPLRGRWLQLALYPTPPDCLTVVVRAIDHRRLAHQARTRAERALQESEARFRLLAESAPVMLWMGDRTGKCLYLNRALRDFWGVPEDAVAGFRWDSTTHPDDVADLFAEFRRGMEMRTGFTVEARYRRADGAWRTLCTEARPRFGEAGAFLGMIGVNVDVTDTREAVAALRASERRLRLAQEAGGIGAWEHDLATGERYWSDNNYRLWGLPPGTPITLERMLSLMHPEDRASVREAAAHAATLVGPMPALEFRVIRPPDGATRWILSTAESLPDAAGQPLEHIGVMRDITEQKEAMDRLTLLTRELDHRAKNALAVVQAALRLTPRDDAETFARSVEGRVAALARAHTLLAEGSWRGTDLRKVIEGALAPFRASPGAEGPGATLEGPPVALGPGAVQALSMALHELATNAAKHGALSRPGGRVAITWALGAADLDASRPALLLDWQETGGPPVSAPPARRGFGATLVDATITRQLGGEVASDWAPSGLHWHASLPLARLVARNRAWEGA